MLSVVNDPQPGDRAVTSVFIIAASDVARAGLESLVATDPSFTVQGSAANWTPLAPQGTEGGALPDVVIFDAERHGGDTREALRTWVEEVGEGHDEGQNVPAVVVIGGQQEEWLREALRAGVVRATLPRSASGGEIAAALAAVSNKLIVLDPETLAALLSPSTSSLDESPNLSPLGEVFDELTPREREVLDMLAEGLSNKEIAWRMKISEHTVKFHVASIFAKLDASTRTEAVMHGIRRGLIMM